MKKYTIEGHEWMFEIYKNNNLFWGKAILNEPCFSAGTVFTATGSYYSTEDSVNQFLRKEIENILKHSSYIHPLNDSQRQQVGTVCFKCKRQIQSNDGWKK